MWVQRVGYGNPHMSMAIAEACGRYGGGSAFAQQDLLHPPLAMLSEQLVRHGPGKHWAERILYTETEEDAIRKALTIASRSATLLLLHVLLRLFPSLSFSLSICC
jgi:bifunctional dethiobiotin synthetase / adenosylmethionine---8-amino-7-oxononanoate aminotransferase